MTILDAMDGTPDWRMYERIAACFEIESAGMEVSVTPNASLKGSISGVARQVDVLVEGRWDDDLGRRIVYDAKHWSRKIDVNDVEGFEGMMRDVRASRGCLFVRAATRRPPSAGPTSLSTSGL